MIRIVYLIHPLLVFGLVLAPSLGVTTPMPQRLQAGVFAGIWAHILFSFYVGRFDSLRTRTFLLLMFAMLATHAVNLASFVLPWGQMSFWLASIMPQVLGGALARVFDAWPIAIPFWPALLFALLLVDVLVMQRWAGMLHRVLSLALAALAVIAFMRGTLTPPSLEQFHVIPHWSLAPGFSILRAMPGKELGLIVLTLALALPLIIPWVPAERFRLSRFSWLWLLNSLVLAATLVLLGFLGRLPPDAGTIGQSQIATTIYFISFIGTPLLMRVLGNRMSRHPA